MKKIFIIGAGRSTITLIDYLLNVAADKNWEIIVADRDLNLAEDKVGSHPNGRAMSFDVNDSESRRREISNADLVISMLPAHMHVPVAKDCIDFGVHMVTASYISDEMKALNDQAIDKGVVLINEIGVDPGIDHLSAMKLLDSKRNEGAEIILFESFTGGLVAPESEGANPWRYKFTWNPRNVVVAGQGGAVKFKQENKYKYIPYHQLFRRTEFIDVDGYGRFEGYANRDSLKYRSVYGLKDVKTIYRGTLRRPGFCRAWDVFVKLGMTDDTYVLENSSEMTYREFLNTYLAYNPNDSVELKLMHYMKIDQDDDIMEKFHCLDVFSDKKIGLDKATPAQCLQKILEQKWTLQPEDRDMVVMYHKLGYLQDGQEKQIDSYMVVKGENSRETAMAKTVGLPVAIAARKILEGVITTPGVQIPITPEIYNPMLEELAQNGVEFVEKQVDYRGY
jgi:saccharopine dehydrogenase-like NADP-dependent oxidoreductase